MRPRDWHSSDRGGSSPLCTGGLVGQVRGSLLLSRYCQRGQQSSVDLSPAAAPPPPGSNFSSALLQLRALPPASVDHLSISPPRQTEQTSGKAAWIVPHLASTPAGSAGGGSGGSSGCSGPERGSMEPGSLGCMGDVWGLMERRRGGTGGLYLLLLCWLLDALTAAQGIGSGRVDLG
ncbi:hypothetical protein NQZ68_020003 [Dissostichus eleginoides]|nr:hypothetical protein NQZ68_020003 [Dissostichus eleginoides]